MLNRLKLGKLLGLGLTTLSLSGIICGVTGSAFSGAFSGAFSKAASAQMPLTPDNSLGAESTLTTTPDAQTIQIHNGATRGTNLFHSFEAFNINEGEAAYFLIESPTIESIFSRITGSDSSQILGTLGTCFASTCNGPRPEATLYLINPNGIFFGPTASLDVGGSFVATTANGLQFGSQGVFSADTTETALLAINPSAFLFSQINPEAAIENQSVALAGPSLANTELSGLRVPNEEHLVFLGGDVNMVGGKVVALDGAIDIGSVSEPGTVSLNLSGQRPSLNFPDALSRANVVLNNGALLLTSATGLGNITVNTDNLTVSEGSRISAGTFNSNNPTNSPVPRITPGNIELFITDTLTVQNSDSYILNKIETGNQGQSGDLIIRANQINIGGGLIGVLNKGSGTAGNVDIVVSGDIQIDGGSQGDLTGIFSQISGTGDGEIGDIQIESRGLSLDNGAQVNASPFGAGTTGDITIEATNIEIVGEGQFSSGIFMENLSSTQGSTGNLSIEADNFTLGNGGGISVSTFSRGNVGKILITTTNQMLLDDSLGDGFIRNDVESGAVGDTGGVEIRAHSLLVIDGAQITANVEGEGNTAGISISATESVVLSGHDDLPSGRFIPSAFFSSVNEGGKGTTGGISIVTDTLSLLDAAQLSSTTAGEGDAGDITIAAQGEVKLSNANILTEVTSPTEVEFGAGGMGDGGDITISAESLLLQNGASLLADTENIGRGGDINLDIQGLLSLSGEGPGGLFRERILPSQITTTVDDGGVGDGGDISIRAGDVSLTGGGFISTSSFGDGIGGDVELSVRGQVSLNNDGEISVSSFNDSQASNLRISAHEIQLDNNSKLTAQSRATNAGNVVLVLDHLLQLANGSQITTNAETEGDGGNINISAPFIVAIPAENSDISANSSAGPGGQVNIETRGVFGIVPREVSTPLSDITASSDQGVRGNVAVTALDTSFIQNNLAELSDAPVDVDSLVASSCINQTHATSGSFNVTSSDLLDSPEQAISTPYSTGEVRSILGQGAETQPLRQANSDTIQEPQVAYELADGRLVLLASCE